MGRIAKLIMVSQDNNNKFYDMVENDDGTFSAFWGRVDVTKTETKYPISKWDSQYKSKVKKGYVDVTMLRTVQTKSADFADISDRKVAKIVEDLQGFANASVRSNYTISAEAVTQKQLDSAQEVLDRIVPLVSPGAAASKVNDNLLELYRVIPRRMKNVKDHLLSFSKLSEANLDDVRRMIDSEQGTLDTLRGQVRVSAVQQDTTSSTKTILDAMGLTFSNPTDEDMVGIRKRFGSDHHRIKRAFVVRNSKTFGKFDRHISGAANKTVWQLWHGSRSENWWSIIDTGLVLRPTNAIITGKMFGYGIYFADKSGKSLGYTSMSGSYWARGSSSTGILALFDVHLGNWLQLRNHTSWCSSLTKKALQARGNYDSLFAEGGADLRNNEYIVYDDVQCTIHYLVEVGN